MADVPAHEATRRLVEAVMYPEHQARKASAEWVAQKWMRATWDLIKGDT